MEQEERRFLQVYTAISILNPNPGRFLWGIRERQAHRMVQVAVVACKAGQGGLLGKGQAAQGAGRHGVNLRLILLLCSCCQGHPPAIC